MTCDDVELELSGPEPSEAARSHANTCERCAQTVAVLGLARLPAPSGDEVALLAGLPATTAAAADAQRRAANPAKQAASLLLAAGLGAVVASATLLSTRTPVEVRERVVHLAAPEETAFAFDDVSALDEVDDDSVQDEANLSDDEVFFEVGWPSPTEGDL